MLPTNAVRLPALRSRCAISELTVLLPLVPVTQTRARTRMRREPQRGAADEARALGLCGQGFRFVFADARRLHHHIEGGQVLGIRRTAAVHQRVAFGRDLRGFFGIAEHA